MTYHPDNSDLDNRDSDNSNKSREELIVELQRLRAELDDRKRVEEDLRRSNALLQAQREASIAGIWVVNEHRDVIFYNQRFCEIWRIPDPILDTNDYWQIFNAALTQMQNVDEFLNKVEALYKSPDAISHDEVCLKDGRVLDRRSAPMRSPSGDYYGRVWYFQDITARKQAEAELRQSEEKFRQLMENIRDVFFLMSLDHRRICYISPAYEEIFGFTCDNLDEYPLSWLKPVHPDDRDFLLTWLEQPFERDANDVEYRIVRPDGELRWLLTRIFPIANESGQIYRIAGISKDITERKRIEAELKQHQDHLEALVVERTTELNYTNQQLQQELQRRVQVEATLREAERRWRTVMDEVHLLVIGIDTQLNITYVNPFALKILGYSRDEFLNRGLTEVMISPQQHLHVQDYIHRLLQQQTPAYIQQDIMTKMGETRRVAWNMTQLRNSDDAVVGILGIGEDITERYQIERMKDEFISVVSHEFRTPLTAIHGALDLIFDGLVELTSDRAQQLIAIASESAERLVYLVDNILDLERLDSGKVELVKQPCNIAELMTRAIDLMKLMADTAGVQLSAQPFDCCLAIDGNLILQVLINLLSNAIKFSPPGGTVSLSAKMVNGEPNMETRESSLDVSSFFLLFSSSYVLISVTDQGRGIPADKLEVIFERFQQVDSSDSRQKGGTGLGLAICRSIVQQHQGHIWAESVMGKGSCFHVALPVLE